MFGSARILFSLVRSFTLLSSEIGCKMQIPSYLSSRRAFSVSQKNGPQKLDSGSNAPEPQSRVPKILTGGLALGSVLLAAYYYGALDDYIGKQQQSIRDYTNTGITDKDMKVSPEQKDAYNQASGLSETISGNSSEESGASSVVADNAKQDTETRPEPLVPEDSIRTEEKIIQEKDATVETPESVGHVEGSDIPNIPHSSTSSDDETVRPAEESFNLKGPIVEADEQQHNAIETTPIFTSADNTSAEIEINSAQRDQTTTQDIQEVNLVSVARLNFCNVVFSSLFYGRIIQDFL